MKTEAIKKHALSLLAAAGMACILLPIRAGAADLYVSIGFDNTIAGIAH